MEAINLDGQRIFYIPVNYVYSKTFVDSEEAMETGTTEMLGTSNQGCCLPKEPYEVVMDENLKVRTSRTLMSNSHQKFPHELCDGREYLGRTGAMVKSK